MRELYHVRYRVGGKRKNKYIWSTDPKDIQGRWTGPGTIMRIEKANSEQLLGIGEFFSLGSRLLKEFANTKQVLEYKGGGVEAEKRERLREKVRKKRQLFGWKEKTAVV